MERHLSLIKTDFLDLEKRVFPRFPFGFMIFKDIKSQKMVFEVKDISLTGMQMAIKDGIHSYKIGDQIEGILHWRNSNLTLVAKIKWARGSHIGVAFDSSISFEDKMRKFLSFENIVSHILPLHLSEIEMDLPNNLKYWLKADGVLDLYVWEHSRLGASRFQIIMMEHFIEWEEGVGLKTGRVMTQRNLETPLFSEDEFVFQIDESVNVEKVEIALGVIRKLTDDHLPKEACEFLILKLGG